MLRPTAITKAMHHYVRTHGLCSDTIWQRTLFWHVYVHANKCPGFTAHNLRTLATDTFWHYTGESATLKEPVFSLIGLAGGIPPLPNSAILCSILFKFSFHVTTLLIIVYVKVEPIRLIHFNVMVI